MIITFPMLVSQAVSENSIPGIAKGLEIYLITVNKDLIINHPDIVERYSNIKIPDRAVGLRVRESNDVPDEAYGPTPPERDKEYQKKQKELQDRLSYLDNEIKKTEESTEIAERRVKAAEARYDRMVSQAEKDKDDAERQKEEFEKELEELKSKQKEKDYQRKKYETELKKVFYARRDAKNRKEEAEAKAEFEKEKEKQRQLDKINDGQLKELERLQRIRDNMVKEKTRKAERAEDKIERDAEKKKESDKAKSRPMSAKVEISDYKTISLEPTMLDIEVTDKNEFRHRISLGIKVLPYRVRSEESLLSLVISDAKLRFINRQIIKLGRSTMRLLYRYLDRWKKMLRIRNKPQLTAKKDIILNRTGFAGKGFILLNKNTDVDENILGNVRNLNRLFSLGWGNIIIADDIRREAHFCLDAFRGVCSTVNYAMLYDNVKKLPVYQSMEDIKTQQGSLFKMKRRRMSQLLGEWVSQEKQSKYTILKED